MLHLIVFAVLVIALAARDNGIAWIIGNGAAAGSLAICDHEVGGTSIAEVETIGDAFTFGEPAKVVLVAVKLDVWHSGCGVIPMSRIGILDDRDIKIGFFHRMARCQ